VKPSLALLGVLVACGGSSGTAATAPPVPSDAAAVVPEAEAGQVAPDTAPPDAASLADTSPIATGCPEISGPCLSLVATSTIVSEWELWVSRACDPSHLVLLDGGWVDSVGGKHVCYEPGPVDGYDGGAELPPGDVLICCSATHQPG